MNEKTLRVIAKKYTDANPISTDLGAQKCLCCFATENNVLGVEDNNKLLDIVRKTHKVIMVDIFIPDISMDNAIPADDLEAIKRDEDEFNEWMEFL